MLVDQELRDMSLMATTDGSAVTTTGRSDDESHEGSSVPYELEGIEALPPGSPHEAKATVFATITTMTANVIGGGCLALPTAFHFSSIVVGIVMLFFTAFITSMNLVFLVACAERTKIFNYRLLLAAGLGPRLSRLVDVALFVFPFGALIAYARVVADAMPPVMSAVFGASGFWLNPICWFLVGGAVFFAFSCRRSLSELKLTSAIALLTIWLTVLMIVVRFFDASYRASSRGGESGGSGGLVAPGFQAIYFHKELFKTIPIIAFSLSMHNNFPVYYEELRDRSPAKMHFCLKVSHAIVLSTYCCIGICGLLTFGGAITAAKGDILEAYDPSDQLINAARLSMVIHLTMVFPILQMAARRGFNNLVFPHRPPATLPFALLAAESFCIVVISCVLAAAIPNIDIVLSFNGSIFGSIVVMIAPAATFWKINPHADLPDAALRRGLAAFSIVVGVFVGVTGVTVQALDLAQGNDH